MEPKTLAPVAVIQSSLYTPQEAAILLRLKEKTLATWRKQGRPPAYVKIGSRVFYERDEIERFIAASRVQPTYHSGKEAAQRGFARRADSRQLELRRQCPAQGIKSGAKKKHLFLSYCQDNKAEVAQIRNELIAAGETVWWDQDILPGQDWKYEIRKAMRDDAYAIVLCLSKETADRITSGVYPEVLDAIAAYREYTPGSIFLIPVRLSDCEIPLIEIDGTRMLDRLQYVDLFPPAQRASGLQQLIKALKAAPLHP